MCCETQSPHHGSYRPPKTKGAGRREPRKASRAALQGPVLPGSARPPRIAVESWLFPGKANSGQPHLQSRVGGLFPLDCHLEVPGAHTCTLISPWLWLEARVIAGEVVMATAHLSTCNTYLTVSL